MIEDCRQLKQAIEEERYRSERLEEQINDQTELHQHEVTNIKQELSSMEEKMEYQLEERTRDMQELLDTCRTSVSLCLCWPFWTGSPKEFLCKFLKPALKNKFEKIHLFWL